LRIPQISSDILISFSYQKESKVFSDDLFIEICQSFCIHDWSLFK
jgi:hypothetical protein